MATKINSICVFASASNNLDDKYLKCAQELGEEIAKNNYGLTYGASDMGLMGVIASAVHSNGGEVIGVMPQKLYDFGISPGPCSKFILTTGMRERKAKMDELSQAVIALPGGFGTLEEISEMIVQKQLGYNDKPIVLLNLDGFYDKLIEFFNVLIDEKFASRICENLYFVAETPIKAIEYINNYKSSDKDYLKDKVSSN